MRKETILCIESEKILHQINNTGFIHISDINLRKTLVPENIWFAPREYIEEREDYRQIIPYIILKHDDSVAIYKRTQKGGEKRLHELFSIGFGGHIGLIDVVLDGEIIDVMATIKNAGDREITEEINHGSVVSRETIGIIYSDATPVDRVHCGVVELWTVEEPHVEESELELTDAEFIKVSDLKAKGDELEGWSALCADHLVSQF